MAAPSPDLTEIVMANITIAGTDFGIVKGMALQKLIRDLEIAGQGQYGASSIGTVAKRMDLTLTYLVGPPIADDTFGDIVVTFVTSGGGSTAWVIKNMLARGYTQSHNEEGEVVYTQQFKNKSNFDSTQHFVD